MKVKTMKGLSSIAINDREWIDIFIESGASTSPVVSMWWRKESEGDGDEDYESSKITDPESFYRALGEALEKMTTDVDEKDRLKFVEQYQKKLKAYKITYKNEVAHYANVTPSKARYDALLDLQDGYPSVRFQDISVLRSPEFDHLAHQAKRPGNIVWFRNRATYNQFTDIHEAGE